MTPSDIALILRWILPLWALGWLILPLSSRLLPFLPDRGLAAGRVIALILLGLVAFWGAALHLVPLSLAPIAFVVAPLSVAAGWKNAAWRASLNANWRAFLLSDLVFLSAFAAFLWVRLRHPEAGDFEKPMDIALLAAAQRADFLPFENPWFAGQNFTNYYYFGPLFSSLLARTFATPPSLAYNLAQPLFCAFFLSVMWSLAAALTKSLKIGLVVMLLVGLGGHLEPLRQWQQTGQMWPLDYWKTSRVIDNTINEYPAFTMLIGDLHAHFYAFSFAVTHFCLCFGLLQVESARLRSALLLLGGTFLSVFALTNTWDTPIYGLLWLGCVFWSRKSHTWNPTNTRAAIAAIVLVPLLALPYFWRFEPQISGVAFKLWKPSLFSLSLLWGGWWMLGCLALGLGAGDEKPSHPLIFRRFLLAMGALAWLFPFFIYIRGAFGDGDLAHQDTVFKFGLQAWLLGGIGIAAEVGVRGLAWWKRTSLEIRFLSANIAVLFLSVISLAPVCVAWTRAIRDAPRDAATNPIYSLNAARFLSEPDQTSIEWLRRNAKIGESVAEATGGEWDGNTGRVGAFSGVPTLIGWPQHVGMWGAPGEEIGRRTALINEFYRPPFSIEALPQLRPTYLFFGAREREADPDLMAKILARNPNLKQVEAQILRFSP